MGLTFCKGQNFPAEEEHFPEGFSSPGWNEGLKKKHEGKCFSRKLENFAPGRKSNPFNK